LNTAYMLKHFSYSYPISSGEIKISISSGTNSLFSEPEGQVVTMQLAAPREGHSIHAQALLLLLPDIFWGDQDQYLQWYEFPILRARRPGATEPGRRGLRGSKAKRQAPSTAASPTETAIILPALGSDRLGTIASNLVFHRVAL
jgi:hypothetical protein